MKKLNGSVLFALVMFLTGCEGSLPVVSESSTNSGTVVQRAAAAPLTMHDNVARLNHSDPTERAWAAYQLGKLGSAASPAILQLIALLQDETSVVLSRYLGGGYHSSNATTPGEEACQTLVKIGHNAVPALQQAVHDPKPVVRQLAAKSLGQIGELDSIAVLIPLLDDSDRQVRAIAALALGSYRHPQAAQLILEALPNAKPGMRAGMVYALAQINDVLVVPVLIQRYPQEQVDVRAAIIFALGRLRDGEAIETLLQGLHDADEIVRANAANALGNYYTPRTMNALITSLSDPSDRVREAALDTLQQLSGMQFSPDSDRWRQWWQQQQANIPPPAK